MAQQAPQVSTVAVAGEMRTEPTEAMRRIDVSDVSLRQAATLAGEHPDEWAEVFFERRGARCYLAGRK